jgi:hypothetical protein
LVVPAENGLAERRLAEGGLAEGGMVLEVLTVVARGALTWVMRVKAEALGVMMAAGGELETQAAGEEGAKAAAQKAAMAAVVVVAAKATMEAHTVAVLVAVAE